MNLEHNALKQPHGSAPVDCRALIASLCVSQSASFTAAAQVHHDVARSIEDSQQNAIATLMQARPGWRAAAGVLGGSFHPGVAARIHANSF